MLVILPQRTFLFGSSAFLYLMCGVTEKVFDISEVGRLPEGEMECRWGVGLVDRQGSLAGGLLWYLT